MNCSRDFVGEYLIIADNLPYMDFCRWVRVVYWNLLVDTAFSQEKKYFPEKTTSFLD